MKRIRTIVIVFIILIAQNAIAEGVFESAPDWLKGVLSIDLFGSDSLEESWPLDRYVCVFDFDASRIDKVKIPSGAAYTKEWQSGGLPIIIYPSEYGYYYFDSYSSWKWREVHYLEIVRTQNEDGIRYTYGEMLRDIWTGEMPERASDDNNVYYGTCSFDSPMRVLGMNSEYNSEILRDLLSVFYLQYGVSSKGEMEIQLVREDGVGLLDERKEIIHSFPLDYDFGAWQYSISNGGRITWLEGRGTLVCADEYDTKTFTTSGRILGFPAWYDDSTILYFETQDENSIMPRETVLKKYDIANDTAEDFLDVSGRRIEGSIHPFTMALNEERNILAVYGWGSAGTGIEIINLDNGETYLFNPWPNYLEETESEKQRYGYAEDGSLYFDPAANSQATLVWFPE